MSISAEALQSQIPYYLTSEPEQKEFLSALTSLIGGASSGYFITSSFDPYKAEMLQGDGWRGLQVISFATGERRPIRGIVLSNSCDISTDNTRAFPPKVIFAPLVKLATIETKFKNAGLKTDQIADKLTAIRGQKITSFFYLPADGVLEEEYVVMLDDVHSMPSNIFIEQTEKQKLFTLSMAGFYLFVFKLSVHFCRLQENVKRVENAA
ncbi:hypothetical protein [Agrobacterium fabrum]|uniref:hypothetical protein n=1 Tax=Agrobacterium fabrum TaxID=1176649 RepID=UPI003B9F3647